MSQTAVPPERGRIYVLALRVLGSAGRWWPILLVGAVAFLGWEELRRVDLNLVRESLHGLSAPWVLIACGLTLLNLGLMGGYDLVTLQGSPVPRAARWGRGTLAFTWSNFLTLGPIAGPAIRFWLYRPYGVDNTVLRGAIVANVVAFSMTLAAFSLCSWAFPLAAASFLVVMILALVVVLLGRLGGTEKAPRWLRRGTGAWAALFGVAFLDWVLAASVFVAIVVSTQRAVDWRAVTRSTLRAGR